MDNLGEPLTAAGGGSQRLDRRDQVWSADNTYIPTGRGCLDDRRNCGEQQDSFYILIRLAPIG